MHVTTSLPYDGGIEEPFKEVTYGFKTKGEYWAFMMGVEQSNGWMEYEEVEEDVS